VDPDSPVCCKKPGRRENQTTVREEKLCFHWCHELYFAFIYLHVEENHLVYERGFTVCCFIRNFNKFLGKKKRTEGEANLDESSESIQLKLLQLYQCNAYQQYV